MEMLTWTKGRAGAIHAAADPGKQEVQLGSVWTGGEKQEGEAQHHPEEVWRGAGKQVAEEGDRGGSAY